jgi:hypothetical protein
LATLTTNELGIVEIAKRTNNGEVQEISEVLSRFDEVWMDAMWVPANQVGSHVHPRRLSLPAGTWRNINAEVTPEASHTQQITENIGRLEAWSQIDEATIQSLLGGQEKFRATEDAAFAMGLAQTATTALVNGDTTTNPEQMDGWRIRLNTLGTYVKDSGGDGGDTTSLFIVQWGDDMCHMIYQPSVGFAANLDSPINVEDRGRQTHINSSGGLRDVFRTKFFISAGFAQHDDRNLCRVTNIEDDPSGASIVEPELMIQLLNSMPGRGRGAFMYAHQITLTQLDILAMDKGNINYGTGEIWGEPVTMFRSNIPIRMLDAIGITETEVT